MQKYNLINKEFGFLEVVEKAHTDSRGQRWKCICKSGKPNCKIIYPSTNDLTSGHTTSCGCKCNIKKNGRNHKLWGGYGEISGQVFGDMRKGARSRNLEFNITIEYIWDLFLEQDRKCALTGLDLRFKTKSTSRDGTASLDRIDSKKGYIEGNVWWLHKDVNIMKMHFDLDYFKQICRLITEQNNEITKT